MLEPILGLSHLTFIVGDADRTVSLFYEGFVARVVGDSQSHIARTAALRS